MIDRDGYRILVVDDNIISAHTMMLMLELALGHNVQQAHNGVSAIAIAKSFSPDVVLLDIGLPDMNGYEVCKAMRQEILLKNTLIIAQTGWGQEEHRKLSKEAGFDYHLVKPVFLDEIIKMLNFLKIKSV